MRSTKRLSLISLGICFMALGISYSIAPSFADNADQSQHVVRMTYLPRGGEPITFMVEEKAPVRNVNCLATKTVTEHIENRIVDLEKQIKSDLCAYRLSDKQYSDLQKKLISLDKKCKCEKGLTIASADKLNAKINIIESKIKQDIIASNKESRVSL